MLLAVAAVLEQLQLIFEIGVFVGEVVDALAFAAFQFDAIITLFGHTFGK